MSRKPNAAATFAAHATAIALAAPQVVFARTARMALAGATPSPRDRREFELMHKEKVAAFGEGWLAMCIEATRIGQSAALSMWSPWDTTSPSIAKRVSPEALTRDALAIMSKGIAPVRRKAVANAKRLGKAKRR